MARWLALSLVSILAACATVPAFPPDPTVFPGSYEGIWFSYSGSRGEIPLLEISQAVNGRYLVKVNFTGAPYTSFTGEAKLEGSDYVINSADVTVRFTQRDRDRLDATWTFRPPQGREVGGGWSLVRKRS